MSKDYSRRDVLQMSGAYGVGFSALASSDVSQLNRLTAGQRPNRNPKADRAPELFRLIDSGFERGQTKVRLRREPTGRVVETFELQTTGTNHPENRGRAHEEQFPHVAADIDSFGNLPAGSYTLEVFRGDLYGKTTFTVSNAGLPPSYNIHARILPDGQLRVGSSYSQPSLVTR